MDKKSRFTHINEQGQAQMVDVGEKPLTKRVAIAYGEIHMHQTTAEAIKNQTIKKGEVLQVARIAGIMAAKKTFELIPLCHLLALTKCEIDFRWRSEEVLAVECLAKTVGNTGVEMEALTGVNVTLLTIYDMCKAMDREMTMTNIGLMEKSGGKSGMFKRNDI